MNVDVGPQVVFLLGAGASVEAGVSTSDKITEIMVNYGSYCPSAEGTAIENIVKYIQVRIADYLQIRASTVNFEYILGTLIELSRRENQPIVPFLGEGDLLVRKLEQTIPLTRVVEKLYALLRELLFIRQPVDYLHPLQTFLQLCKPLDLFTLNYDLSIETALSKVNVPYTTGYRKREQTFPIWDPAAFEQKGTDVRIFKLHGSLDWGQLFDYPPPPTRGGATFEGNVAAERYIAHYPERMAFDPFAGDTVQPPDRTLGLVGVMNFGTRKELLYASSQFTILFNYFLKALQTARTCVVAGYSFRDERINTMLEEALVVRQGDLHLVVVDPSVSWTQQNNPILSHFMYRRWATGIAKPFGETLQDGSLLAAVEQSLQTRIPSDQMGEEIVTPPAEETEQPEPMDPKQVLDSWRMLGDTVDLLYFWWRVLAPDLRPLDRDRDEEEAVRVGRVLQPILRKIRDLCHQVRWLYEDIRIDESTYGGEHIDSINVSPELIRDFSCRALPAGCLPNFEMGVNYLFNVYNGSSAEFQTAVTDPDYGERVGAPSHLSAAAMVIRKVPETIYSLAYVLNEIYRGAGYEEPFAMIASHRHEDDNAA